MIEAKREQILSAAAKVFAQYGYRKTSVDDVAKAAGVARGTVYLKSESKEDLFYQTVHREVRAWMAEIARDIDPNVPADVLLATLASKAAGYLEARPLVRDLLFDKYSEALPALTDRLQELRLLGAGTIAEVLRLGIRQGLFRSELDVEAVSRVLQDLQLPAYVLAGRVPPAELERRQVAALDLVLNGLKKHPKKT